ncbi:hypothetical protein ACMDB5_10600 [Flavobacterium sp. W1B]|uniref:hypothetical protein n=1 Tax=Flavobacterium sp. W1B TaxID=3394146 RepID=UPI0039BC21E1
MENNIVYNKQLVRDFYAAVDREDYESASTYLHQYFIFYHQVDHPIPGAGGFVASEKKILMPLENSLFKS